MSQELWSEVDRYIGEQLVAEDSALAAAVTASIAAGLPPIAVSPAQGKLLHLLARIHGARRVLELGTLGGYSTIWLARALPADGRLVTLELEARYAEVAVASIDRAGVGGLVEVRVGPALDSLHALAAEGGEPFDLIFIDADKKNIPGYLGWALKLARVGTVILTDNVVREGAILDPASADPDVQGVRAMFDLMANEPRLSATAIQTVGSKGYDGFAIAVVVSN
jgi:predicted O-methyltransferase YrrM